MYGVMKLRVVSLFKMAHNGLGIADGGALKHQSLIKKQMFNMSTKVQLENVSPTIGNTLLCVWCGFIALTFD